MADYTRQIVTPLLIQYVGVGTGYYQGIAVGHNPFYYQGPPDLLFEMLLNGDYKIVDSGPIGVVIATTDQIPGYKSDGTLLSEEDYLVNQLLNAISPVQDPSTYFLDGQTYNANATNLVVTIQ